jgi:hypothetical protein
MGTLRLADWLMLIAVVFGPVLAVITQILHQRWNEKRQQKFWVFSTLMSLRASALAPDYVRALNYIDVVFFENEKIRTKWRDLLAALDRKAQDGDEATINEIGEARRDTTAELLAEMAKELGYDFDHTAIKNRSYTPQFHADLEEQQKHLRQFAIAFLNGESTVKVALDESGAIGNAAGRG